LRMSSRAAPPQAERADAGGGRSTNDSGSKSSFERCLRLFLLGENCDLSAAKKRSGMSERSHCARARVCVCGGCVPFGSPSRPRPSRSCRRPLRGAGVMRDAGAGGEVGSARACRCANGRRHEAGTRCSGAKTTRLLLVRGRRGAAQRRAVGGCAARRRAARGAPVRRNNDARRQASWFVGHARSEALPRAAAPRKRPHKRAPRS
jgi:hypothetical protein